MKQFTRRNSKTQLLSSETVSTTSQQERQGGPGAKKTSQHLASASADPYSFSIEDDTGSKQAQQTAIIKPKEVQVKAGSKRPCSTVNASSATATAAARLATKAVPQQAPTERQPSPPKQPRLAGAQHVASCASQQTALQRPEAAAQQPPQTASLAAPTRQAPAAPAPPAGKAAAQAVPARPQKFAANSAQGGAASGGARCRVAANSNPSTAKAASGGNSRKPAGNGRRSQAAQDPAASQQQRQPQRLSSSPPDSVPDSLTSPASNSAGALSLPTPHRRSRLSAGLLAAAAAAGGAEGRPAQTVMEAQERGELVQMQDDASYAMDGLAATCSMDTQRDGAVTLTEMLSTRKGRVALRSDGLAQQFLTSLAKLKASKDCVLGLAATLSLWYLSAEDANPCYLASVAAAVLVDQLLQHDYTFDEVSAKSAAGAKLCRLVRLRPLTNLLTSTGVNSSRGLLLVTLEQATNSQHASKAAAVEKLKHNLRQHGALQRLAALVADAAAAPGGAVAASKQLHVLLLVLENATFTCPDNGNVLAELRTGAGSKGAAKQKAQQGQAGAEDAAQGQGKAFPAVLVGVAQQLLQGVDQEQPRAALHALLSVMMNLIHDNKQGGALLCSMGGMDIAADTYSRLLLPAAGSQDSLCEAVLKHLELVSVSLGVLMNLVSNEPQHSKQLAAAGDAGAAGGSSSTGVSSFVRLLCTVMSALGQLLQHYNEAEEAGSAAARGAAAAAAGSSPEGAAGAGVPSGAKVVTSPSAAAEALGSNTASEASIVEVYSGILLGFLVRDGGPALAQEVAPLLPGGSLDPLLSATGRCLDFYVRTGAITDHTKVTLEQLLQQLTALKPGGEGSAGQDQQQQRRQQDPEGGPEVMEIE